jgi:hypothetical protein
MIEYSTNRAATDETRDIVKSAGVRVTRAYTKDQSNGSFFTVMELDPVTPNKRITHAIAALRRAGYEDVHPSALGKVPTLFARSWQRGRRRK